jgi:hypothetical protein
MTITLRLIERKKTVISLADPQRNFIEEKNNGEMAVKPKHTSGPEIAGHAVAIYLPCSIRDTSSWSSHFVFILPEDMGLYVELGE